MKKFSVIVKVIIITVLFFVNNFSQTYPDDTLAVRAVLDTNGLTAVTVKSVTDSSGGRIIKLDLYRKSISKIPAQIGNLNALKALFLDQNSLTGLPAEISNLKVLDTLDVKKNKISALPPQIGDLTALKWLSAESNLLSAIPAEIGSLKQLTSLYLRDNVITTLPNEIGRLKNLTNLELDTNYLTNLPDSIVKITSLFTLDLGYNQLDSTAMSTAVKAWADKYDPDWRKTQGMTVSITVVPVEKSGDVSLYIRQSSIHLRLPVSSYVSLQMYDAKGRLAATLVNACLKEGTHKVPCDVIKLGSGIYYLKLFSGKNSSIYKLVSIQ